MIEKFFETMFLELSKTLIEWLKERVKATMDLTDLDCAGTIWEYFIGGILFALTWVFWSVVAIIFLFILFAILGLTWPWGVIILLIFLLIGLFTAFFKWKRDYEDVHGNE